MKEQKTKEGWSKVPIAELFAEQDNGVKLGQGWSPQCLKVPSPSENVWGVLKTTAIQAGYFLEEQNKQLPDTLKPRTNLEVKKGDILITCAGPRNRCGVACLVRKTRKKLIISGKMYRFRLDEKKAIPEYIEAFLQTREAWDAIDKMKTGISDSGLNLTHSRFKQLEIPIPSVKEQKAVIEKIDELLSDLENGKQQLETAQQQLKVYRHSLMKWAFDGRLTNKSVNGELPKNWQLKKLGEVVNNLDGKRVPLSRAVRATRKGKFRYYGATEIVDYIDDFLFDGEYLLIGEDGANLLSKAKPLSFVVEGKFWVNNHAHVVQAKENLSNKFLCYYFNSLNLSQFVTGTAQPKLTQSNLNKVEVRLPPLKEQQKIVDELESKLTVCDKIEETITNSLQQAEMLKQSILKKAFEGKLITTNEKVLA